MRTLKFTKMQGAGNDFMVINGIAGNFVPTIGQLRLWSDRNFGVGFDQLLLLEESALDNVDFKYRIFNADGSEVNQCGNGARCFAKFALDNNLTEKNKITVETGASLVQLQILDDDRVRVNMGVPDFSPTNVPLALADEKVFYPLRIKDKDYEFMAVSIGNPHAVFVVDAVDNYPVSTIGAIVEPYSMFPERANAGFMQIVDKDNIKLRVFERGVGETLACGSGACAAVVCGINAGLLHNSVKVVVLGGELLVEWQGVGESVYLTGSAVTVYKGEIKLS